jgi:hypothetical protein
MCYCKETAEQPLDNPFEAVRTLEDPGDVPRPVAVRELRPFFCEGGWGLRVVAEQDSRGPVLTPEYVAFHRVCTGHAPHAPDAPDGLGGPCPRLEAAAVEAKQEGSRAGLSDVLPALVADAMSPEDAERLLPLFRSWVGRTELASCATSDAAGRPFQEGRPWDLGRVLKHAFGDLGNWVVVSI